ncbi:ABC transporter substrate-binding protein, partial [Streptomyces albus]|uniref:ABC transporter substrate-binding protein n=1 Tax=Streptomyces albus TaxID=1888 RepID=UPI000AEEDE61
MPERKIPTMQFTPSFPVRRATRPAVAALCLTTCVLALAGCGTSDAKSGSDDAGKDGGAEVRVTDATGTAVTLPRAPKRVVVLSEMDLDSSLALGVKPVGLTAGRGQQGAPAYLAGQAKGIPVVGAVTGPDIEKVVRAKPDVILAGQLADKQVLQQLRKIAPTVVTIDRDKDWKRSLELTGKVLGRSNKADAFLDRYAAQAAALKKDLGPRA